MVELKLSNREQRKIIKAQRKINMLMLKNKELEQKLRLKQLKEKLKGIPIRIMLGKSFAEIQESVNREQTANKVLEELRAAEYPSGLDL